jgi:hypothetical protein
MIIGRLHISFDRGTATNRADDLGLSTAPDTTTDGKVVRGLGTHYRSVEDKALAVERGNEEGRVRTAFKRMFVAAPIPGCFVLPSTGAGQKMLDALDPPVRADVQVSVSEYVLDVLTQAPAEVQSWAERVQKQIQSVPLGRGKGKDWADTQGGAQGISILEGLASCPIIGEETRQDLADLIADAKLQRLDRVTLKRKLDTLTVDLDAPAVAPRRAPITPATDPLETAPAVVNPRRRRRSG